MKKTLISISIISLLILATSCHFYKEYDKESFPTYSWKDGQEVVFTPKIDDNSKDYEIKLGLRYHYGFQSKSFGVNIKMVSPSGKESNKDYDLKIKDEGDNHIGNCAGDICDLETVVLDNLKFEEVGEYTVSITHNERGYTIPGIMEVGLIINEQN